ncbi:23S rRNA (adenine(1618)-N(6))-methyltransferase RlmF [Flavihumibacter sp. R14]|nr:23S rRNA (adenine(1618)-N(6))-methyltransferase RlmF [Flavihumibacter soli]
MKPFIWNLSLNDKLTDRPQSHPEEKSGLHPRNPHRYRYDFPILIGVCSELSHFVFINKFGGQTIDFTDPKAVKALNKALLRHFYNIEFWDIPEGYLCPPIPGRADYIHYAADLLASVNAGVIPLGKTVRVLDIGTGANCIYPLIGHSAYGWNFVGSDIDHLAIRSAKNIVEANALSRAIQIRRQGSTENIFGGVVKPGERFELSICNPPFHSSASEAQFGTVRKWRNLGHAKEDTVLNFGGKNAELWCTGGEAAFLDKMIRESADFAGSIKWFSSLISKKTTLPGALYALKKVKASDVRTINMAQGQKVSRILAWTFNVGNDGN